ncbi:MAG TPA: hypothetical protein VF767_09155 [Bryobacteraceae bacterium]
MRKTILVVMIAALTAALSFAQNGTPSSKATAQINTAVGCTVTGTTNIGDTLPLSCHDIFSGASVDVGPDNFVTIMSTPIKISNSQSLFVSPSLVTGLYTNTAVKTHTGSTSTATAEGGVYMRAILTDPVTANVIQIGDPVAVCTNDILGCQSVGKDFGVVLDSRVQTLSQTLSACVVDVVVGGVPLTGTCSFDSTVQLILKTTSAHTFNFIFPNVGVGVYNVAIQVAVDSNATLNAGNGTAIGAAAFGLGSVTVESVRLVHNFAF